MFNNRMPTVIFYLAVLVIFIVIIASTNPAQGYPVSFADTRGQPITIKERPCHVVSLAPSITEMIFRLEAGDAVKGITYHDADLPGAGSKTIIGGFFKPSVEVIETTAWFLRKRYLNHDLWMWAWII